MPVFESDRYRLTQDLESFDKVYDQYFSKVFKNALVCDEEALKKATTKLWSNSRRYHQLLLTNGFAPQIEQLDKVRYQRLMGFMRTNPLNLPREDQRYLIEQFSTHAQETMMKAQLPEPLYNARRNALLQLERDMRAYVNEQQQQQPIVIGGGAAVSTIHTGSSPTSSISSSS